MNLSPKYPDPAKRSEEVLAAKAFLAYQKALEKALKRSLDEFDIRADRIIEETKKSLLKRS